MESLHSLAGLLGPRGTTLFGVVFTIAIVWWSVSAFRSWYRLSHVPGPLLASTSSLWMVKNAIKGRIAPAMLSLQQYGRLVRVAPNYILTDDPDTLRQIASARSEYYRDEWWEGLKITPGQPNLGTILEIGPHDKVKAKMSAGYAGRDNMDMESRVDARIMHLKDVIRRRYVCEGDQVKSVDLARLSYYFTLDVITDLSYGEAFGFLDAEGDLYHYTRSLDQLLKIVGVVSELPALRKIANSSVVSFFLRPKLSDKAGLGRLMGIARDIIEKRFESGEVNNGDMLGSFMRHGIQKGPAIAETTLQLIAGAETSSTVIRSTMGLLMTTPRVYQKLKVLINETIQAGEASSPITVEEAKKLPYLQAILSEGIRMRPPAPYGHYKVVPPGGDTLNGLFIPEGTAVGHNSFSMMRRKEIFGEDVEIFRPERWLECGDAQRQQMDRTIDIHFGGGRWMCAGKLVAYTELYKIYFELLREFDFQLVNPSMPYREDSFVLWRQRDMHVRVSKATW
ncbi:cytochrome P450 [Diaporthe helianthi]|uniref:Cytochrome P450 n=1 Tax=Diaporthe helianthi TaxID=158607 RepID=A0A2P5I9K8_DIAHE|nr:cytochrome P450 [Diaporthe helianthi]